MQKIMIITEYHATETEPRHYNVVYRRTDEQRKTGAHCPERETVRASEAMRQFMKSSEDVRAHDSFTIYY